MTPEELEVLLEQVAPHAAQVIPQEIRQPHFLCFYEVLGALQQPPPRLGQDGLLATGFDLPRFLGTDLIDGLAEVPHDVKAIQDVNGLHRLLRDDLEYGFHMHCR